MNLDDLKPTDLEGRSYVSKGIHRRCTRELSSTLGRRDADGRLLCINYWPPTLMNWRRLEHHMFKANERAALRSCTAWNILREAYAPHYVSHVFIEIPNDKRRAHVFDGVALTHYVDITTKEVQHINNAWLPKEKYDVYWHNVRIEESTRRRAWAITEALELAIIARLTTLWHETYTETLGRFYFDRYVVASFSNEDRKYVVRFANHGNKLEWVVKHGDKATNFFDLRDRTT